MGRGCHRPDRKPAALVCKTKWVSCWLFVLLFFCFVCFVCFVCFGFNAEGDVALFHFTDSRNLPSIRKYGLLSWKRLVGRNIVHWPASSEDSRRLDARLNLEDYIRLCRRREHPMATRALHEGRIQDYVWIEISDVVTQWTATLYSSDNAVAKRAIINNDPRTALESDSIQAEILVLSGLNARWITFPTASAISNTSAAHINSNNFGFDMPF